MRNQQPQRELKKENQIFSKTLCVFFAFFCGHPVISFSLDKNQKEVSLSC